jgi:hypothetical protein
LFDANFDDPGLWGDRKKNVGKDNPGKQYSRNKGEAKSNEERLHAQKMK